MPQKSGVKVLLCFAAFFLITGPLLIAWGLRRAWEGKAAANWPTVEGTVVSSGVAADAPVSPSTGRTATYLPEVRYEYTVRGAQYTCDRITTIAYGTGGGGHAREVAERYPPGAKVTVYYNPEEPERALLEPGVPGIAYVLFAGALVFVGGGVLSLRAACREHERL